MEAIHHAEKRSWISKKIAVKQFRDNWHSSLTYKDTNRQENKSLRDMISPEEYAMLQQTCEMQPEPCAIQEPYDCPATINIPPGINLETVALQKEDLEKRRTDQQYESVVHHSFTFYNYPPNKIVGMERIDKKIPFEPVNEPEVILTVQIYRPEKKNLQYLKTTLGRLPAYRIMQEYMVLGSQYLTELRDIIDCVSDKAISGEISECPDMEASVTCKDLYKSGTFYIDGVFYNDMRDPDCRDYSETIIKWAEDPIHGIGPFYKATMENTKFLDLTLQLGYPYVYIHQGHCEHLLVFSDLKMFQPHDLNNRNAYPMTVNIWHKKMSFCMICHVYFAEWVVRGNKRLPEDPFLFCKSCFKSFNYNKKDQKIGSFHAYRCFDHSPII